MFEVDLFCGVIYQTCWDPDCRYIFVIFFVIFSISYDGFCYLLCCFVIVTFTHRGYRSPIVQAPATVIPSYNIVEEMCFDMKLARAIDMDPTAWPLIS